MTQELKNPADEITRDELDSYLQMLEIANDPANYSFELEQALLELEGE